MDTGIGEGILKIAFALMSIAILALLIGRAKETTQIVSSISTNFNDLLRTVTLQDQGLRRSR